jgi:hypothetical protein
MGGKTSPPKDGHHYPMPEEDLSKDGNGLAPLVSAVESLRLGTRRLSDGQQSVLAEYEHIVEQLSAPTFTPPAPEISEFVADEGKVKIYGKHLRQPISVTIAGVRARAFEVKAGGEDESAYIEADVPARADAGPIVVLTSGGSGAAPRPFRAGEVAPPARADDGKPAPKRRARGKAARPARADGDKPAPTRRARGERARRARPDADEPPVKEPART